MLKIRCAISLPLTALVVLSAEIACSQDFPSKAIRIFAGGVGGSADFAARLIAQGISGPLGQPVIVENRAAPVLPEIVARSAPDGHTLQVTGTFAIVAPFLGKVPYDPVKDFTPITLALSSPLVLVVHPSLPVKSVKDLIALAKAKPGALNYGTAGGFGGSSFLSAELFKAMAGVNFVSIPYTAAPLSLADTVSGQLQVLFSNDDSLMGHIKSGRLRALAVTSAEPSALYSTFPTVAAAGLPGYEATSWQGLWAPSGTPTAIITRLNQEIVRVLNRADVKEKFLNIGTEVVATSPAQFAAQIKAEMSKWGKVIRDAGIRGE